MTLLFIWANLEPKQNKWIAFEKSDFSMPLLRVGLAGMPTDLPEANVCILSNEHFLLGNRCGIGARVSKGVGYLSEQEVAVGMVYLKGLGFV